MKKVVLAALFAVSSPVFAQGYVGIGFGQSSADVDADPDAIASGWSASVEDTDTAFKIFGGIQINENFGIEAAFTDFGEMGVTYSRASDGSFANSTAEASAISLAAIGYLPINQQASLFGKFGFARWDIDVSQHITNNSLGMTFDYSASESGIDPLFGIGVQFAVNNVALRAEFERFMNVGDENTTGQSDVDVIGLSAAVKF